MNRRQFLQSMMIAIPGVLLSKKTFAMTADFQPRTLSFRHLHTNEKLTIEYFSEYQYQHEALNKINYLLRDFRSNEIYPIDPKLLDLLHTIQLKTGSQGTYEIISGYRSLTTNKMLRNNSNGVAKRSLHMQGKAIDIRLTDISSNSIRQAAIELKTGGVGYYKKSNFVHLDTGKFRTW